MKYRIEDCIRLAQEWMLSGMTQAEFARLKGITERSVNYQVGKVREKAPESLNEVALAEVEFSPVPKEYLDPSRRVYDASEMTDQPSLMIQAGAGCLQATNQIDPYLLKVAMEVLLSC